MSNLTADFAAAWLRSFAQNGWEPNVTDEFFGITAEGKPICDTTVVADMPGPFRCLCFAGHYWRAFGHREGVEARAASNLRDFVEEALGESLVSANSNNRHAELIALLRAAAEGAALTAEPLDAAAERARAEAAERERDEARRDLLALQHTIVGDTGASAIETARNLRTRAETAERRVRELEEALGKAKGYMLNAKIDLATGTKKATTANTLEGGLRMIEAALAGRGAA